MRFLPRCLFAILLVCGLPAAYGQDLRTGIPMENGFLAAGECLAWLDAEGNVQRIRPMDRPLTTLVASRDRLFALDAHGRKLLELDADGQVVAREALPVRGHLQDLAADGDLLWVVTDEGEIVHGNVGNGWKVLDFNAQYTGYYPQMAFRAIAVGGGSIMVAGARPDGTPAAYTSTRGTVWNERTLDYTEQGFPSFFTAEVTDLSYDPMQDRFYLLGSCGSQLALPACSHCNSLTRYPVDILYTRIPASFASLLLGSDGFKRAEIR